MVRSVAALVLFGLLGAPGCIHIDFPPLGGGELTPRVVYGEGKERILMLDVDGALSTHGERGALGLASRESVVARIRQVLEAAREDDRVRGVLLRIDSPGGTVIASEILYREIQRFKRESGLPVVAQLMGVAASGGYYVAMAADEVRAYPATVTGSIGVVMGGLNLAGLMEKVGVENQTLTTGAFKDAGSPLRPMRPEERAQLQSILDDMFAGFLDVVERGRPGLERARIEELADGRIFTGRQALEIGLVDALGDLPEAVDAVRERAGIEGEVSVIVYHRGGGREENLFSNRAPFPSPPGHASWLGRLPQGPAFLYLWAPWSVTR